MSPRPTLRAAINAMHVHVGCCGFPVSRPRYFGAFRVVEVNSTFYQPPRLATAERWRLEAPKDFQFTVKAWQLITHPPLSPTYRKLGKDRPAKLERCGHFRQSPEVRLAWERTLAVARALRAKIILFQTPFTFRPDADRLRDLYAFFRDIDREGFLLAWEPRGAAWSQALVGRVIKDLKLVHAVDPLHRSPAPGSIRYFRLHGGYDGERIQYRHRYSGPELESLGRHCREAPSYVFFNNSEMYEDAQRFMKLA